MSTIRKDIIDMLREGEWAARDIPKQASAGKRGYDHLGHIRRSLRGEFRMRPAECLACGFRFSKRDALKPPSRCPVCRGEHIHDPVFFCAQPVPGKP